jgi:hypothetical protein
LSLGKADLAAAAFEAVLKDNTYRRSARRRWWGWGARAWR